MQRRDESGGLRETRGMDRPCVGVSDEIVLPVTGSCEQLHFMMTEANGRATLMRLIAEPLIESGSVPICLWAVSEVPMSASDQEGSEAKCTG